MKKTIGIVVIVALVLSLAAVLPTMAAPGDTGSSTAANKMVATGTAVQWIESGADLTEVVEDSGATLVGALDDSLTDNILGVSDSGVFVLGNTIKIDTEYMYVKSIDVPVDSGADLVSAVTAGDTVIEVTDGTVFAVDDYIMIDDEVLQISAIDLLADPDTLTVSAASEAHRKGSMIFIVTLNTIMVDRGVGDDLTMHNDGATINIVTWEAETILLEVNGKYSNPTDLMIQFTAESALFTKVSSGGPELKGDVASAQVEVWVEVDGTEVLVDADDSDGSVVLNNREFGIKTLNLPERSLIELYLKTKSANAFNWVQLDAGQLDDDGDGMLCIQVMGRVQTNKPETGALAGVGKRVLIVEPTKMASGTPGM